jgi:hypothetical protein
MHCHLFVLIIHVYSPGNQPYAVFVLYCRSEFGVNIITMQSCVKFPIRSFCFYYIYLFNISTKAKTMESFSFLTNMRLRCEKMTSQNRQ